MCGSAPTREMRDERTSTHVQLARETSKARLAIHAGENVEGELLGAFDDDVFAGGIPTNHVVVFGAFEES